MDEWNLEEAVSSARVIPGWVNAPDYLFQHHFPLFEHSPNDSPEQIRSAVVISLILYGKNLVSRMGDDKNGLYFKQGEEAKIDSAVSELYPVKRRRDALSFHSIVKAVLVADSGVIGKNLRVDAICAHMKYICDLIVESCMERVKETTRARYAIKDPMKLRYRLRDLISGKAKPIYNSRPKPRELPGSAATDELTALIESYTAKLTRLNIMPPEREYRLLLRVGVLNNRTKGLVREKYDAFIALMESYPGYRFSVDFDNVRRQLNNMNVESFHSGPAQQLISRGIAIDVVTLSKINWIAMHVYAVKEGREQEVYEILNLQKKA